MSGRSNLAFTGPIYGHYRVAALSGLTTGIAAGATIFAARMAPSATLPSVITRRALSYRFKMTGLLVTPFTAGQEFSASAFLAHQWSAADTGGTALTLTAPANELNSLADIAPSLQIQVAGAGAMTNGTRNVDVNPFLWCAAAQQGALPLLGLPFTAEFGLQSDQQYGANLQGTLTPFQN